MNPRPGLYQVAYVTAKGERLIADVMEECPTAPETLILRFRLRGKLVTRLARRQHHPDRPVAWWEPLK